MNRKQEYLHQQVQQLPRHHMDEDKQKEIYNNIMQSRQARIPAKPKRSKKKIAASLASAAALVLVTILGLSHFSQEADAPEGIQPPPDPSHDDDNDDEGPPNGESNQDDDIGDEENDEDAEVNRDEDEVRQIVGSTLDEMNAEIDDIMETHNEWFREFVGVEEGDENMPDAFDEAVDVFEDALEPVMTDDAFDAFHERLIIQTFCECDAYHRWTRDDLEKDFQVQEQTQDTFIATSEIEETMIIQDSWTFEWHFKQEDDQWKIDDVQRIDTDE